MKIFLLAVQAILCLMVQAGPFEQNFEVFPKELLNLRPRIVGGQEADLHEFPFVVYLMIGYEYNGRMMSGMCGGSILSSKFVLTAAHCVHNDKFGWADAKNINVAAGMNDISKRTANVQTSSVKQYYRTAYNPNTMENDIVILELSQELNLNSYVQPICLTSGSTGNYAGTYGKIMGWGISNYGALGEPTDDFPTMMQKLDVEIISNQECSQMSHNPMDMDSTRRVCIAYRNNKIGACMGDSGGPLVVNEGGKYKQVGLLSHGSAPCGYVNGYDVYTRVSGYASTVEGIVGSKVTC
jgi:secreted trypsin-like serine protease